MLAPATREPAIDGAAAAQQIAELLKKRSVVVLSGAGLSTACGIPDYRDVHGRWKGAKPIDHREFVREPDRRRRYWARSFVGWPVIALAQPSAAHRALAQLEQGDYLALTITQNVDGLHQKGGSSRVLELHGGLARVVCLDCAQTFERRLVQQWLASANREFARTPSEPAPDGDARLAEETSAGFQVPGCQDCGGVLKPDVVFFGDSVPRERVARAMAAIEAGNGLLVIGSSLMVYSGFRFVAHARACGKPVMAINLGKTRADELLDAKLEAHCDPILESLKAHLAGGAL